MQAFILLSFAVLSFIHSCFLLFTLLSFMNSVSLSEISPALLLRGKGVLLCWRRLWESYLERNRLSACMRLELSPHTHSTYGRVCQGVCVCERVCVHFPDRPLLTS